MEEWLFASEFESNSLAFPFISFLENVIFILVTKHKLSLLKSSFGKEEKHVGLFKNGKGKR